MTASPGTRILFIGNSYTARNNLPLMLTRLGAAAQKPVNIETQIVIANGMALKTHWERGLALQALRESTWDYVVLQEQSTLPLKNRARMHEYIGRFDEAIRQQGARTVLYLTWSRQDSPDKQQDLTDAYTSIGQKLGALVAPVGVAWQTVLREQPQIGLFDKDGSHPTPAGSYLAACVFFTLLFQKSPVGLWCSPPGLKQDQGQLLQSIAWQTLAASGAQL